MPWASGRPCLAPGCPEVVTTSGLARCPAHQRAFERARFRALRPKTTAQGYGGRWQRLRAAYLRAFPDCAWCGAEATEVDHVVSLRDGGGNDWQNLRPLCHRCHSRRTARDQPGGFAQRSLPGTSR